MKTNQFLRKMMKRKKKTMTKMMRMRMKTMKTMRMTRMKTKKMTRRIVTHLKWPKKEYLPLKTAKMMKIWTLIKKQIGYWANNTTMTMDTTIKR